jgi:hypothetical protein
VTWDNLITISPSSHAAISTLPDIAMPKAAVAASIIFMWFSPVFSQKKTDNTIADFVNIDFVSYLQKCAANLRDNVKLDLANRID